MDQSQFSMAKLLQMCSTNAGDIILESKLTPMVKICNRKSVVFKADLTLFLILVDCISDLMTTFFSFTVWNVIVVVVFLCIRVILCAVIGVLYIVAWIIVVWKIFDVNGTPTSTRHQIGKTFRPTFLK